MNKADFWIGLGVVAVALIAISQAWGFASVPGMRFGAWTFPMVASSGLLLCGSLLCLKTLRSSAGPVASAGTAQERPWLSFALVAAAPLFYIFTVDILGFIACAALILFALSMWFWGGVLRCLLLGAIGAVVFEVIFGKAFAVPLPHGLFSVTGMF